jgi:hypothetical protein
MPRTPMIRQIKVKAQQEQIENQIQLEQQKAEGGN